MVDVDYVRPESWIGLEVHRLDPLDVRAECSALIQRRTSSMEDWARDTLE